MKASIDSKVDRERYKHLPMQSYHPYSDKCEDLRLSRDSIVQTVPWQLMGLFAMFWW